MTSRRWPLAWMGMFFMAACAAPAARTLSQRAATTPSPPRGATHERLFYLQELTKAFGWVRDYLEDTSVVMPAKSLDDTIRRLTTVYPDVVEATHLPDGGWRLDDKRGTVYSMKAPPSFGELALATGNTISFYYDALAGIPIDGSRVPERFGLAGLICNLDRDSTLLTPLDMRTLLPPNAANWDKWARAAEFDRTLPATARCESKASRPVPVSPRLGPDGLVEGVLYVAVRSIPNGFARGLRRELEQAAEGGPLRGLILDLRGSTGGLYEQAIAAADIFLPAGGALIMYSRHGDKSKLDSTKNDAVEWDTPVVVLVDGATAAGSEMFAAVLQERGRALLMGSRTLGRGTIQVVFDLAFEIGAVKLTTARIRTAGGHEIEGVGVVPDVSFAYMDRGAEKPPPPDTEAAVTLPITADPAAAVRFAQLILATAHGRDRKALLDAARVLSGRVTHQAAAEAVLPR